MRIASKLLPLLFISSVSLVPNNIMSGHRIHLDDIDESIMSIKYIAYQNETEITNNLFSDKIEYNSLQFSDRTYVANPRIQASVRYNSDTYKLCNYKVVGYVTRPDGESMPQYIATYVHEYPSVLVSEHGFRNNGQLSEIHFSYEITNSFEIESKVTTEVGVGAEAFGFGAKAGITASLSASGMYGAGSSMTVQYDFNRDSLTLYDTYSIAKYETSVRFITLAYNPTYKVYWDWFNKKYKWEGYKNYSFYTQVLTYTTFALTDR